MRGLLIVISSLTLPFKALHLGPGNDSTKRGKLGGVRRLLNARRCDHLHFNVNDGFPHKKRVGCILNGFPPRRLRRVPRGVGQTMRVVGDFYLTNMRGAVGRCGGGWVVIPYLRFVGRIHVSG